ncbi:MAG TPA: polymer-forming cytoskeletal protein [Stellaceae bacterium]|nr:polymer-forming cytoskeletal protein [Stellaceae bacterium]
MFGRKKHSDDDKLLPEIGEELGIPAKPGARPSGAAPTPAPARPPMPAAARPLAAEPPKPIETPKPAVASETPRTPTVPTPVKRDSETRKLIVGREISLSGEITACDRLVVEGSVEANLANCRDIDIAESGLFKGSASIDDAEIRGRFEGTLNVRRRLLIRATGRVIGTVRYGQIEIECGGQISGDVQAQPMADVGDAPTPLTRSTILSLADEAKAS